MARSASTHEREEALHIGRGSLAHWERKPCTLGEEGFLSNKNFLSYFAIFKISLDFT